MRRIELPSLFIFTAATMLGQVTGAAVPELAALDPVMQGILSKYQIPGGALAVSRGGKLLYARGFGLADVASATPVQPDSLFRLASVSKTFTAAAVLELVQQGKIQLDQSAFGLLTDLPLPAGETLNPQLASVTVRELLNMTGGWDRTIVPDPVDSTVRVSAATGFATPLSCGEVIQYMLGRPLQHAPGSTYAYSNFGYCMLGQIVSEVSGMSYQDFVRQNVLAPLGIQRAKEAEPMMSDKVNGEVTYYDWPGAPLVQNVYQAGGPMTPAAYGGWDFLATQASGGWVTTPIELLRFVNGLDGARGGPLLQPATIQMMEQEAPAFGSANSFYGLGFDMSKNVNGYNWTKDGGLPGTSAFLYRGSLGLCWAVLFNSAPQLHTEDSAGDTFEGDYVAQIQNALGQVKTWPAGDQFANWPSALVKPAFRATNPVVNGASFQPGITAGSWVTLYGTNLATDSRIWFNGEFNGNKLPTQVDNVSVTMNGQPAAVYYVSPGQLNVQAPGTLQPGPVTIVVTHDGQASDPVTATAVQSNPALFTYGAGGKTFAAAILLNGSVLGDPSAAPGTTMARAGDYIELFGTGFGPSPGGTIVSSATTLSTPPSVTIGGVQATVSYAGLVGSGLFQINVQVPRGVASGNQPVVVNYGGAVSPASVIIPVSGQ